MICMMFNVKLFLLFIRISLYVFDNLINVSRSHPTSTPISHNETCNILVASRSMPPIHFTYSFELFYLLKIIFLIYLCVPYLLLDFTCIKVSFVNFKSNLSILPKRYENNILSSGTMQVRLYLYTFFLLFEHFLILFMHDKTFISCFPSKISVVTFTKRVDSVIHRLVF